MVVYIGNSTKMVLNRELKLLEGYPAGILAQSWRTDGKGERTFMWKLGLDMVLTCYQGSLLLLLSSNAYHTLEFPYVG